MITIQPFKALRPVKELADKIASKPYDVLNSREAKEETKNNPYSFLHITKSEIDLPDETDIHSKQVYEKAKNNLQKFTDEKMLFSEEKPCYYIYQLTMNGRSQTGLACLSAVEDYFNGIIKKHELTRPEKEKDRIDHITATKAQTGKVFLAYKNIAEIDTIIDNWKTTHQPVYNFIADDDVAHTIWVIDDDTIITMLSQLFKEKVQATYIADGHHRAASAAKVSSTLPDNREAKFFLTVIFPDKDLYIMDYNRVVKDLNGLTLTTLINLLDKDFEISQSDKAVKPAQPHETGMYAAGKWYRLLAHEGTYENDPIGQLDVTILSANILEKHLGIKDIRTDKRVDFVGGIRGLQELERLVDSGAMQVAFSLYPVTIRQLFDIADAGKIMPPKSTWFEPKLRDGLLTHLL